MSKLLSFPQINNLVVKHKSKTYFGKDMELFKKHFPKNHRLDKELGRANDFSFEQLSGQMIYELLMKDVSIDEILANRNSEVKEEDKGSKAFFEERMNIVCSKFTAAELVIPGNIIDWANATDEEIDAKIAELVKEQRILCVFPKLVQEGIEITKEVKAAVLALKETTDEEIETLIANLKTKATGKESETIGNGTQGIGNGSETNLEKPETTVPEQQNIGNGSTPEDLKKKEETGGVSENKLGQ